MSELLAVFLWVSIAVVAFAGGLVAVGVTRRRLEREAVAASAAMATVHPVERVPHTIAA